MSNSLVPYERIAGLILEIRDQKVILDRDLATLYGVSTRVLNQSVRRNIKRFPEDFMFQLNPEEFVDWKSQFVTSDSADFKGLRKRPFAFTEQGIAMLSSVLHSDRAIEVNVAIMRTFVQLRDMISTHKDLARKLEELEKKYDNNFRVVFEAIKQLMAPPPAAPKPRIGFR